MGKSNKKVKSDRINALRKQYDAFVEEDKKRKERNEYILGRLDKMRYSNALVPVRNKHSPLMNRSPAVYHHLGYQPEVSMVRDLQPAAVTKSQIIPDIPVKKIDDTYLIQEISKNYILIPKLRSPFMNNYIREVPSIHNGDILQDIKGVQHLNTASAINLKPSTNENADWKSKYEILNILKKEETEKQVPQFTDKDIHQEPEMFSNNDTPMNNIYDSVVALNDNKITPDMHTHAGHKYLDDLPEKDMPLGDSNYEVMINDGNTDNIVMNPEDPVSNTNIQHSNEVIAADVDAVDDINYGLQNTNLEYNYSETNDGIVADENTNYTEQAEYPYTESIDPNLSGEQVNYEEHFEPINDVQELTSPTDQNIDVTENAYVENESDVNLAYDPVVQAEFKCEEPEKVQYVDEQDTKPIQVISSNELSAEINNSVNVPVSEPAEYIGHESESTNLQELPPTVEFQMKTTAEHTAEKLAVEQPIVGEVHKEDSQNPQPQIVNEISEKEEQSPDAAGIQDYEAEQQGLFYSENPNLNYEYEQGGVNVYDQHQPQDQVYPPTEDYSYYENQQVPFSAEVGENEEQTLQYDQSYQGQYADQYQGAYENQPQEAQQYDESQAYQQEQLQPEELEQYQQHYETELSQDPAQIESQLNVEDRYEEQNKDVDVKQVEKSEQNK